MGVDISKNLVAIRKHLGFSQEVFAEKLGLKRTTYASYESSTDASQPDYDTLIGISTISGVKIDIILTNTIEFDDKSGLVAEPDTTYITKSTAMPVDLGDTIILYAPLVSNYAYAGYLAGYGDKEYIETLPAIPWQVDKEHKGNYRTFEVRNDSMDDGTTDSYKPGDKLLGREIPPDNWQKDKLHIKKWKDFIIVHRTDGILLKQIIKHDADKGVITIHSLNPAYEDTVVNLADIVQLFNVVQSSRNR